MYLFPSSVYRNNLLFIFPTLCVLLSQQALANLGEFYLSQHKRGDARQCLERAAAIYAQTFGHGHARTQAAQQALARVV